MALNEEIGYHFELELPPSTWIKLIRGTMPKFRKWRWERGWACLTDVSRELRCKTDSGSLASLFMSELWNFYYKIHTPTINQKSTNYFREYGFGSNLLASFLLFVPSIDSCPDTPGNQIMNVCNTLSPCKQSRQSSDWAKEVSEKAWESIRTFCPSW